MPGYLIYPAASRYSSSMKQLSTWSQGHQSCGTPRLIMHMLQTGVLWCYCGSTPAAGLEALHWMVWSFSVNLVAHGPAVPYATSGVSECRTLTCRWCSLARHHNMPTARAGHILQRTCMHAVRCCSAMGWNAWFVAPLSHGRGCCGEIAQAVN
jgi:hypothetical protein